MTLLGEIEGLKRRKTKAKQRIEKIIGRYDAEIKKLYAQCDHVFSQWEPIVFREGGDGCKRGCELCGKEEVKRAYTLISELESKLQQYE